MVLVLRSLYNGEIVSPDDASVSSTFTVDNYNKEELQRPSNKKRAHFDMSKNRVHNNTSFTKDVCQESWYAKEDYQNFKSATLQSSQEIIRLEAINRAPYSYHRVIEHIFDKCIQAHTDDCNLLFPNSELVHLQHWMTAGTSRYGLEKWSNRKIARDRSTRRKDITETVVQVQNCIKISKSQIEVQNQPEYNDKSYELIRGVSEYVSRPSRLYARTLARALAESLRKESIEEAQPNFVHI